MQPGDLLMKARHMLRFSITAHHTLAENPKANFDLLYGATGSTAGNKGLDKEV